MLYRGMDRATLDAAYNNTAAVGRTRSPKSWTRRSRNRTSSRSSSWLGQAKRLATQWVQPGDGEAPGLRVR
jgi:hypothetical protein